MDFDLKRILLALLLSTSEALTAKDVQKLITRFHEQVEAEQEEADEGEGQTWMQSVLAQVPSLLTTAQFREAMEALGDELEATGSPYRVEETAQGYRLGVAPELSEWVRLWRDDPRPQRLSPSALETLTIVAYRQPVTRSDIEAIRGVASDNALSRLVERDLVRVLGRADLPGRPLQYGTTAAFLDYCGIRSLEELPASDILSPRQITEWLQRPQQSVVDDRQLGLPTLEEATEPSV